MRLEGSCHCGAVTFSLESNSPCPYQLCYCSICRKMGGSGGFGINIGGDARTMQVQGEEHVATYRAKMRADTGEVTESTAQRRFCRECGSHLWLYDPTWPALIHPYASAIDSPLPGPPERTHIMLGSKPAWVQPSVGPTDKIFQGYPEESLADWHARTGAVQ
ncbi:hypothetical protein CLOM_g3341 [Closterium sp. NIES-68]|nr:hypothetical protein CLOM_g3341 [Closterium sp. NIES-68]GJP83834.1 hypothetical protein CLOP_g13937 [Closterium sp. NIES-67]